MTKQKQRRKHCQIHFILFYCLCRVFVAGGLYNGIKVIFSQQSEMEVVDVIIVLFIVTRSQFICRAAESSLVTSMDCEEGLLTEKYLEDDK